MRLLLFLLRQSKGTVALAALAGIIAGLSSMGLIALTRTVLSSTGTRQGLVWGFVGLCAAVLLSNAASHALMIRLGQQTLYDVRLRLCRKILAAPLRKLEEVGPHSLLAALTDDVGALTSAVLLVPSLFVNLMIVLSGMAFEAWLDWSALLVMNTCMVLAVVAYQLATKRGTPYLRQARQEWDALFKHFRAMTEGIKELKLHHARRRTFFERALRPTAEAMRRNNTTGLTIHTLASCWGNLLFFFSIGLILFAVPSLKQTSSEALIGFTLVSLYMIGPVQSILTSLPHMARAQVSLGKIEQLGLSLDADATEADPPQAPAPEPRWGGWELAGVAHTYRGERENERFTLGPLDLSLRPGEVVFLIGGNGSGKTTLAKILTGLYPPESGEIRFNGQPVTDENREAYRQQFSVVFSDSYVFESLLGMEGARLDELAGEYLRRLQLDHKVQVEGGRLSTTDLSQGQRKRLALLTAYLEDRPIYVFDEWAADQDPVFREIFYLQLLPELKARGKTVIVISHDDRYYYVGDRIIKLDFGRLVYDERVTFAERARLTQRVEAPPPPARG